MDIELALTTCMVICAVSGLAFVFGILSVGVDPDDTGGGLLLIGGFVLMVGAGLTALYIHLFDATPYGPIASFIGAGVLLLLLALIIAHSVRSRRLRSEPEQEPVEFVPQSKMPVQYRRPHYTDDDDWVRDPLLRIR